MFEAIFIGAILLLALLPLKNGRIFCRHSYEHVVKDYKVKSIYSDRYDVYNAYKCRCGKVKVQVA